LTIDGKKLVVHAMNAGFKNEALNKRITKFCHEVASQLLE